MHHNPELSLFEQIKENLNMNGKRIAERSPEELAKMTPTEITLALEQETQARNALPHQKFYLATTHATTKQGGVIVKGSSNMLIECADGVKRFVALVGDVVVYPNGDTAVIVSGSGSSLTDGLKSVALVGSLLDNGDEIIGTMDYSTCIPLFDHEERPKGFLEVVVP